MTILPCAPSEREHLDDTHLDPFWTDGALRAIETLAAGGAIFSADDLRADPYSIPEPAHPSHWGALFAKARAQGIIRPVGFIVSRTASRNGGALRTWRGNRTAAEAHR
ncbi:hypothetical protein [Phycicoccus sp.]|uniref:hypothetical protein n=1 Tax=Phycicoccus sp. TaxID=1902410 RepID=UPI002C6AD07C|nr:hypothetical protein [Phycicoccus sp.]HMM96716.1 hypothetical protein [Phycicoccus sp.]